MLRRFVSAAMVASVVLMISAIVFALLPGINLERASLLFFVWLCVPTGWGIWAILAPKSWVPRRLPSWGAILGVIAGVLAAFVVDVPYRVLGLALTFRQRFLAILALVVVYYLLWTIVRGVLVKVSGPETTAGPHRESARAA